MALTFEQRLADLLSPTKEGGNKFGIQKLQYPDDLEKDEFGHYIMFFINEVTPTPKPKSSDQRGNNVDASIIEKTNNQLAADISVSRRNEAGAGQIKSRESTGSAKKTTRISKVLSLYMPDNNTVLYGADYENADVKNIAGAFEAGDLLGRILSTADNVTTNAAAAGPPTQEDAALSQLTTAFSQLGQTAQNLQGIRSNIAVNPHMEFLFRNVRQRTFSFEFIFTPRSKSEAKNIYKIIKEFKKAAIPELKNIDGTAFGSVFYEFPKEFDIAFISNGKENKFMHKISTCALTNISVTYTQAGVNSMHKGDISLNDEGDTGTPPTHTNLRLEFAELELMTRQRMEEGF